jgi:hypothetical protein
MLGTAKHRQRTRSPSDDADLAPLELEDWRGRQVRLGEFWSENPAVVVFLRHYG